MNIIKPFYEGRGYIYTGVIMGTIYPLMRGNHESSAIAAGIFVGGLTGLFLAPFHDYFDRVRPLNEAWLSQPKNYLRPAVIAVIVLSVLFALHYFIMA